MENGNFTYPRDVCVFARVKPDCVTRNATTRQHDLISISADGLMLMRCSEEIFTMNKNWLLNHPVLSCYTEIQRINLKSNG